MIKAVIFDIDNTLLDFDKCSKSSIFLTCSKFGVNLTDNLFRVFKEVTGILWRQIEDGEITRDELRRTRWAMIFEHLNIKGIDPLAFENDFRVNLVESSETVAGAMDTVKYLSSKYSLYCASNAPAGQQEHRMEKAGLAPFFKDIFISGNINLYKPNADFFDYCLERMPGIRKDEILMIGDDLRADIEGAITYGLKTCYFDIYNKKEVTDIRPTYTITSLSSLKDIL